MTSRGRIGNIGGGISTFGQGPSQQGTCGWPEKRQRSNPSVMSLGREGMYGRMAKVRPGPAPSPQGPGGRFRGTCEPGPLGNGE